MLGDALAEMPASIQARLFAAFGLELFYNKHDHQVTIYATITPSHPRRDHRRQRTTRRTGRSGPSFTAPQNVMVAPTITIRQGSRGPWRGRGGR